MKKSSNFAPLFVGACACTHIRVSKDKKITSRIKIQSDKETKMQTSNPPNSVGLNLRRGITRLQCRLRNG